MPRITGMGKPDNRGRYYRELGWELREDGTFKQHRFTLGKDRLKAEILYNRLDSVWAGQERRWYDAGRPGGLKATWDEVSLKIALAVARGEEEVTFQSCELPLAPTGKVVGSAEDYYKAVAKGVREAQLRLQRYFPSVLIRLKDDEEEAYSAEGQAGLEEQKKELDSLLGTVPATGVNLHTALDQYVTLEAEHYKDSSEYGTTLVNNCKFLKKHVEDVPLSKLDLARIERILGTLRGRPLSNKGKVPKPCSLHTARALVKLFNGFLGWLDGAGLGWTRPRGQIKTRKYAKFLEDQAAKHARKRFKRSELQLLYKYASPQERLYLLLSINCGMGGAELTTLLREEIHLRDDGKGYIQRCRYKTDIPGRWPLWPETVEAIRWWMAKHPGKTGTLLGLPRLVRGRRNQVFNNAFVVLLKRIRKDYPDFLKDFRGASFSRIKDTGASMMRCRKFGGNDAIASTYIAHGQTSSDPLLDNYADRAFADVAKVLRKVHRYLKRVFAVPSSFQDGAKPRISLETSEQIKALRREGLTYKEIRDRLKVGYDAIRRHSLGRVRRIRAPKQEPGPAEQPAL